MKSGLETLDYNKREGYRIRLGADDLKTRGEVLRQLIEMAYRCHVTLGEGHNSHRRKRGSAWPATPSTSTLGAVQWAAAVRFCLS